MSTTLADWLAWTFGGDSPQHPLALGQVAMRAMAVYIIGLILVRVGKSRLISRASMIDVILGFLLGSLLSRGITGNASISSTAVASAALIAIHFIFTYWSCRSHRIGKLVKGNSRLLIENGAIDIHNLRRSHLSHEDLMEELRLNANCGDVSQVKEAYKERSGEVGVVLRKHPTQVINVSVQSGVQTIRIELQE
jgi:uncharacterized membrane protein YcaP (DUF421 family)